MNKYPELFFVGNFNGWYLVVYASESCSSSNVHLPGRFSPLWQGHEGKFSVYVHASKSKPVHVSRYFVNRDIRSGQVHIVLLLFSFLSFVNCILSYVWVYMFCYGNHTLNSHICKPLEMPLFCFGNLNRSIKIYCTFSC